MTRWMSILLAVLVTATLVPTGTAVPANEPPLPDAGLDQTVERGTTVLLDGTGSRDPDGTLAAYDWTVRDAATNTTVATLSGSTPLFTPPDVGRYAVTLAVTDDAGATRTDTLYVTVESGDGPNVSVSGPDAPEVGSVASYTASLSSGAANLSYVTWRLDGTILANRSIDSETETDEFRKTFPSPDERELTVTLTDEDGLAATSRLAVDPRASGGSDPPSDPIAPDQDPTVRGPQLVTGAKPLDASYSVTFDAPDQVTGVQWHDAAGVRDGGSTSTVVWRPGLHDYYAVVTYTDGSSAVAKFPDGTTSVVADPKPNVTLDSLSAVGGIGGTTTATDGFDNLDSLAVRVDGSLVARWPAGRLPPGADKGVHSLDFDAPDVDPNGTHRLKLVATDRRGQRDVITRAVDPKGVPRVISSGFVNTPVDSYHDRIDANRYAGHHVIRIALNGVDPAKIESDVAPNNMTAVNRVDRGSYQKYTEYDATQDTLAIHSYWSGSSPGSYNIKSEVLFDGVGIRQIHTSSTDLEITPSDPELRLDVTFDGTPHRKMQWGIVVDASRSFDPDGTELRYIWLAGAEPIKPDNTTAKFRSYKRAGIVLEDDYNRKVSRNHSFHEYYAPDIKRINSSQSDLLTPNETVKIPIQTKVYSFTKNRYEIDLESDVRNADAEVENWHRIVDRTTNDSEVDRQWSGTLVIEASEFVDGGAQPKVIVRNSEKPRQTVQSQTVPTPAVVQQVASARRNVSVSDLQYQLHVPQVSTVEVQRRERFDHYKSQGYSVTDTSTTGTEYTVQRYEKVQEAEQETKAQHFARTSARRQFLDRAPSWHAAGTNVVEKQVTVEHSEWRNSMGGRGQFRGSTRRIKLENAEYRIKKEFEYTDTVERTGTKTVTRYDWSTYTVERTRTETVCNRWIGCYEREETYTVERTRRISYQETVSYTYEDEITRDYWAFSRQSYDHHPTGDTRRVKIDDAEYETQYLYHYTTTETRTEKRYVAETTVQTQEPKYGWRDHLTTADAGFAQKLTTHKDYRVGSTSVMKEWTLKKQVGEKKVIRQSFDESSDVIETRARVTGDLHRRGLDPRTGKFVHLGTDTFSLEYTTDEAETRSEVVHSVKTQVTTDCRRRSLSGCRRRHQ